MDLVTRGGVDLGKRRHEAEAGKDEAAHRDDGGEDVGPAEQEQGGVHGSFLGTGLGAVSSDRRIVTDGEPAPK